LSVVELHCTVETRLTSARRQERPLTEDEELARAIAMSIDEANGDDDAPASS
jgi:hypothetical protein